MAKNLSKKVVAPTLTADPYDMYEDLRNNPNNLSYWFPKIKDIKNFHVPKTIIIPVGNEICDCFWCYDGPKKETFQDEVYEWVKDEVMPKIQEAGLGLVFLKNGCFSNKFDFKTCTPTPDALSIASSILSINYMSLTYDTGGVTELIIRERIWNPCERAYKIYDGMPLVPEIRVFYDFDKRKILYSVNYWDAGHCEESISHDPTDALAYTEVYPYLEKFYQENHERLEQKVAAAMKHVDLSGCWSVDLMYEKSAGEYWLIDMAIAQQSAYWDPERTEKN
ncbi:MAG: hypothetical protein LUE86_05035 [Clostridiales bacterium]|nr:hypothetical protein [Clostridiales bacterium]